MRNGHFSCADPQIIVRGGSKITSSGRRVLKKGIRGRDGGGGGSKVSPGIQLLISIEIFNTCDMPGGGRPPPSPPFNRSEHAFIEAVRECASAQLH